MNARDLVLPFSLLSAGGCLFDHAAKTPPSIQQIDGPAVLHRGMAGTFTAVVNDSDNGARVSRHWGHTSGPCPQAAEIATAAIPDTLVAAATYPVTPASVGPLCVWLRVVDDRGATAVAVRDVVVENRAPVAEVTFVEPAAFTTGSPSALELYTTVTLAPAISDADGDTLTAPQWTIVRPDGVATPPLPCDMDTATGQLCFELAMPGAYTVTLTVSDPYETTTTVRQFTAAADRPPCLVDIEHQTAALLRRDSDAVSFAVSVDDDGDPHPPRDRPSQLRLDWFVRAPGQSAFLRTSHTNLPQFDLPAGVFQLGDTVEVRVEVRDRVPRDTPAGCNDETPRCEWQPGCPQRLTWTVGYLL